VAWQYGGTKAPEGRQVAVIGAAVMHDGIGSAILLEQIDLDWLQLQAGPEGNEYAVRAEASKCLAVDNLELVKDAGSGGSGPSGSGSCAGGSGTEPKRRNSRGRKRKELSPEAKSRGLNPLSTKADVQRIGKRLKREAEAVKRGKPLKPLKAAKNRNWPTALKEQAVAIYHAQFAGGKQWEACTKHLLGLPGFDGLTRANVQSWVNVATARADQEPNEYGLIVTRAGRPPTVPADLYEELKALIKGLAQTRAIRVCTSSMQPVVRPLIVHRLGAEVIRSGKGGFIAGAHFLKQLASDAGLRWRKPYGEQMRASHLHKCTSPRR